MAKRLGRSLSLWALRLQRASQAAAVLLLACALAACAPGTGGTGTGPGHEFTPGVQPQPSEAGFYLGNWGEGPVLARFEAERIRISQGCVAVEYNGPWAPTAAGEVQVAVQVTGGFAGAPPAGAILVATGLPAKVLRISVRDGAGNPVIGPVELMRSSDSAAAPGSGC